MLLLNAKVEIFLLSYAVMPSDFQYFLSIPTSFSNFKIFNIT